MRMTSQTCYARNAVHPTKEVVMEDNQKKDGQPSKLNFPLSDKAKLLKNLKPGDFAFTIGPGFPIVQVGIKKEERDKDGVVKKGK